MKILRTAGAVALIATALGPASAVFAADAQANTASEAVALDKQLSGHLGPGGTYAYYKFEYPADGTTATVNLEVMPENPAIFQNVSVRVYGPDGKLEVTAGSQPGLTPNIAADVISSDMAEKGTHLVQVSDFDPNQAIDFQIWVTGVAQPAAATVPAGAPAPAPEAAPAASQPAAQPAQNGNAMQGHLDPGGKSAEYEFNYPGDQSVYTVGVQVTPDNASVLADMSLEVYDNDGNLVVKGGGQPGLVPNLAANVITLKPGRYVVKIVNYDPTRAVDYTATVTTGPKPSEDVGTA